MAEGIEWHDLRKRGLSIVIKLRQALRKGGNEPTGGNAELDGELERIQTALRYPKSLTEDESVGVSILKPAWLRARWEALLSPTPGLYPDFAPSVHFTTANPTLPMDGDSLDPVALAVVLKSEGRENSQAYQYLYPRISEGPFAKCFTTFQIGPDMLGYSSRVQTARAEVLDGLFAEEIAIMGAWQSPWDLDAFERGVESSKAAVRLLVEAERLKFHIQVDFTEQGEGSRTQLGKVRGIDPLSAATFVNVQRLCVLLLWLVYKDKVATLDHGALPYLDLEDSLHSKGLADASGVQFWTDGDEEKWTTLVTQTEELMAECKAEVADPRVSEDAKAWSLRGRMLGAEQLVLAARRVQSVPGPTAMDRCEELASGYRHVWFLVGQTDSATAERIAGAARSVLFRCAMVKAGLNVRSDFIRGVHDKRLRTLCEAITRVCPSGLDDALQGTAPTLGFLDPGLSRAWVIQKHCEHIAT